VIAEPAADGVRVEFVVRRNFYNNVVRIEGLKEPPTEPAAIAAMRMGLGEPFRESALREAIDRLQDVLSTEGLFLAKVTWDLGPHDDTRQMDITVHIDPGPRARVGNIVVKNETRYPDAELIRRSKIKDKNEVTSARLTRGSQRIRKFLVNQGYLGAGAVITVGAYDAATNRAPLNFNVTAGSHVRVEVTGARLSKGRLRKLLRLWKRRSRHRVRHFPGRQVPPGRDLVRGQQILQQ
jgi:outer membrane protein insertion porin family